MIGWQAAFRMARELEKRQSWDAAAKIYKRLINAGEQDNPRVNFRLGNCLFRADDLGNAEKYLTHAVDLDPTEASWHYRLGFVRERQGRYGLATESYRRALDLEPSKSAWKYRLYKCYKELGENSTALDNLRSALNEDPGNPKYHDLAAQELRRSGPRWQEAKSLERGLPLHQNDPTWHTRMADSYAALSRPLEAARSYRHANELQPNSADLLFKEGAQWAKAGQQDQSRRAFDAAVKCSKDTDVKRFGVGAFYQKLGDWDRASAAYEEQIKVAPLDGELLYRAGLSHDRCYRWETAAAYYLSAVSLEDQPYWHYKLGFSYERMNSWDEAAAAYEYAAVLGKNNRYWWYRSGYARLRAGRYEDACKAFMKSSPQKLPSNSSATPPSSTTPSTTAHIAQVSARRRELRGHANDVTSHKRMADKFCALQEWQLAADSYDRAIHSSNEHRPELYYLWGNALFYSRDFKMAAEAFRQTRIFNTPDGIDIPKYLKNQAQKHSMQYLEYYETSDLAMDTILWESNHGSTIGCHPLALFRYLVDRPEFAHYRHVWAVNDPDAIPEDLRGRENVFFTKTHSDLYIRMLATASHLINNVSFPPYFIRRNEQKYLNTWHGTPFKTLGKDMRGAAMEHSNLARNFLHSTHIMSPNEHTSWALIDRHDLTGLFRGQIMVTGSPRLDRMISSGDALRRMIRKRLGIDDDRPVVLYAPTWRGSTTDRVLDSEALRADLDAMASAGHHLLFRAHRLTEKLLSTMDVGATVVPPEIDTNDLLAAVDVLVTDYSSIAFDFVTAKKPIIYYTYDFDEYKEQRGLYLDPKDMPGDFCYTRAELIDTLNEATAEGISQIRCEEYEAALDRFAPLEDGHASARVTDFFFNDEQQEVQNYPATPNVLFHHSLIPNGIATSFRNLVGSISPSELRSVLVVEPHMLKREPSRLTQYEMLPESVQLIGRVGQQSLRGEERWLQDKYTQQHTLHSVEQWNIYMDAMRREFRRIFGPTSFAAVVEFDGYSPFWTSLLASGGERETVRTAYLHNDMLDEWKMKFANLEAVFRLYPYFDNLLSVSQSIGERNSEALAPIFGVDSEKFGFAHNQIDAGSILVRSTESLDDDLVSWFEKASFNAVTIGRLSPEKDHAKLIRAFVKFHQTHDDSNLLIIGDGPLRNDLEHQITQAGARDYIQLAGQRLNPYPALGKASAFVLSSLHEGQPMVLFEAMILDRPIVCTDMPGPRDILQDRHGLIVDNSEDGLVRGLTRAFGGGVPMEKFDYRTYVKDAKEHFLSRALPDCSHV